MLNFPVSIESASAFEHLFEWKSALYKSNTLLLLYKSRKCKTTVKVQAVATMELCFIDVSVGWPGAMHDSRIFRNIALSAALRRNLENTPYTI